MSEERNVPRITYAIKEAVTTVIEPEPPKPEPRGKAAKGKDLKEPDHVDES